MKTLSENVILKEDIALFHRGAEALESCFAESVMCPIYMPWLLMKKYTNGSICLHFAHIKPFRYKLL